MVPGGQRAESDPPADHGLIRRREPPWTSAQLDALLAIADHKTFSSAARSLHTVQSNVSKHIARLEQELGARLVDRDAGTLTEEGEAVVARARRIRAETDAISHDMAAMRDDISGVTRLGIIDSTARWLIPIVLPAMEAKYPNVPTPGFDRHHHQPAPPGGGWEPAQRGGEPAPQRVRDPG